jgi:hypothetical protein
LTASASLYRYLELKRLSVGLQRRLAVAPIPLRYARGAPRRGSRVSLCRPRSRTRGRLRRRCWGCPSSFPIRTA